MHQELAKEIFTMSEAFLKEHRKLYPSRTTATDLMPNYLAVWNISPHPHDTVWTFVTSTYKLGEQPDRLSVAVVEADALLHFMLDQLRKDAKNPDEITEVPMEPTMVTIYSCLITAAREIAYLRKAGKLRASSDKTCGKIIDWVTNYIKQHPESIDQMAQVVIKVIQQECGIVYGLMDCDTTLYYDPGTNKFRRNL